jgi:hypothetical protein
MPENQTSLQEAMARIMGLSPGGIPQGPPETAETAAPRPSYSGDISARTPETNYAITNTPYDPFGEQQAELAAAKAQTALMQAQLAQSLAAQQAQPAYTPPPLPAIWTPPPPTPTRAPASAPVYRPPPAPWYGGSATVGGAPVISASKAPVAPVISGSGNAPVIRG